MTGQLRKAGWLTVEQIALAVDEIVKLSKQQDARVALAGGGAMQIYGSDRFTKDVDFVADRVLAGIEYVRDLSFGGIQALTSASTPVDLIIRDDDYRSMYEEALEFAVKFPDVPIRVISAEHLAAMKMAAGRDKDMEDLRFLLTACLDFNFAAARAIVMRNLGVYAAHDLDSYLAEFQWKNERDEAAKTGPKKR